MNEKIFDWLAEILKQNISLKGLSRIHIYPNKNENLKLKIQKPVKGIQASKNVIS